MVDSVNNEVTQLLPEVESCASFLTLHQEKQVTPLFHLLKQFHS